MYAKVFTSIYQGTLRGNANGILVFTNLLAHCDKTGVVDMHPRAIADEVGIPAEKVREALNFLESPDAESRTPDEDGRRIVRVDQHRDWGWRVVNYAKYRAIRNEDDRAEQNRLAQARWREKAKVSHSKPASAIVSSQSSESAQAEAEAEVDEVKTNTARKRGAPVALVSVEDLKSEGIHPQVAADWLKVRKDKKAPLTKTAWEAVKREAASAGMTPAKAVTYATESGWQGFKASWVREAAAKVNAHDPFAGSQ